MPGAPLNHNDPMQSRITAFVMWALVALSAAYWALPRLAGAPGVPANAVPVGGAAVIAADLSRLLGAAPVAPVAAAAPLPEASSRFHLLGVMAPRAGGPAGAGLALISVDGKPARAFRVGGIVDSGFMLRSVALRSATFGTAEGLGGFTLELPPIAVAATGTLPAGGSSGNGVAGLGGLSAVPAIDQDNAPEQQIQVLPPTPDATMPAEVPGNDR